MTTLVLKQTETMAVVKVYGASGTIDLQTDLLSPTMELDGGTQTVNIAHVTWYVSGGASDSVVITRGGTTILHLYQNGEFDFSGNGGFADSVNNTQDILVTITGTGGCYLTLRKVSGYKSKIQPWIYGPYDNEASTTS